MIRKIYVIVISLLLTITIPILPTNNQIVHAADEEVNLDYDWIYELVVNLSNIVKDSELTTHGIYAGRDFGSIGEIKAATRIKGWMENNIKNLDDITNVDINMIPVGDDDYTGEDWLIQHRSNNKIDVLSYGLKLDDGTNTATISNNESFPVPQLILQEGPVNITSRWLLQDYQDVVLMTQEDIDNQLKKGIDLSYQMLGSNQEAPGGFGAEVVLIDDYSSATINDTTNKVHLLEFDTTESEDTFLDKVQNVIDTNGTGYIAITSNPSFIQNLSTSIFGIAVTPQEGEKIKNFLNKNQTVVIEINNDENTIERSGVLTLYPYETKLGNKKIGLIEEHSDYGPDMSGLCLQPVVGSDYIGFLLYNKTWPNTHYLNTPSWFAYKPVPSTPPIPIWLYQFIPLFTYSMYIFKPFMYINGSIHLDGGGGTNIWEWAAEEDLDAKFWINEYRNASAESYNVLCEIEGKDPSKTVMISGGHHDFFPGQGASDNAVGVATMLGILRYLNESKVKPKYNLIFASWAGEERILRGSGAYVFDEANFAKNEKLIYMINTDWFAFDSPGELEIQVTNGAFKSKIADIVSRTNYHDATGYTLNISVGAVSDDARPFYDCYVDIFGDFFKKYTGLKIVTVGKENLFDIVRHRSGGNNNFGDVLDHIDRNDLNYTADIILNISRFIGGFKTISNELTSCDYNLFDQSGDTMYDSVNISFDATTNLTSWATVKACLYNTTTGEPVTTVNSTGLTLISNDNVSGYVTLTLPASMQNDTYNATISIYNEFDELEDENYQLVNLTHYSLPIANYDYTKNSEKTYTFYDQSLSSPGATINHWEWSYGDGNYSEEQNPSHTYIGHEEYEVTLTVWDTNGYNDSWSDTLTVPNCSPYTSFSVNANAVCVGTELSFTSTSNDEDGTIENYTWCFGDESYSYEENPVHSYSRSGVYTVTLTTIDDDGATNTTTKTDCFVIANALVDDDFHDDPDAHEWDTITEGLNDVENGNVVYVFNGHYEPIEITKSVALYGESRESVLIRGGNPGVKIRYHNVSVNGFNVSSGTKGFDVYVRFDENHTSNVTIENCNIYGNSNIGILLNQSSNCTVENCTIIGNNVGVKIISGSIYNVIKKCMISHDTYGVYVSDSSHNYIGSPSISSPYPTDCTFTFNQDSIYLKDADSNFILGCDIDGTPYPGGVSASTKGISLNDSENNTISTCYIHDMTGTGVYLNDSTWNKIEHCKITENPNGVYYYNSPENLIVQNHFGINSEFGVYLPSNSQNNHIYYNDFFVNGNGSANQSFDANERKGAENLWSKSGNRTLTKSGRGEGNYWSDYTGDDNDQDGIGDTPYQINSSGVERNDSYPVMEPYGWCDFTQDSTPPVISNVSAAPSTVGFGYNVTIRAMITDNSSNIRIVKVNIIYPDQSSGNYTMDCIGGSLYQYTFSNTWTVGQYNYTIWAMDETYNSNSSGGHHFHVSATATINIATLKNSYSGSQYINITDPPNPLENLTLVGRGLTWNTYYNSSSGNNILEAYQGPVNYQDDNSTWMPINNSLNQLTSDHPAYNYGYRTGDDRGLFGVYFKPNIQSDWPVAFTYNRSDDPTTYVIRSKLVGVGYVDPQSNWAYQYLQNVQNSQGQTNGNSITYSDVFTGTDVTWSYGNTELKEEITLSNVTKTVLQNHPPSMYGLNNGSSYLVFITKLDHQNLDMYNTSGMLNGNVTISNAGIDFKDALGQFKCALPLGEAYELNNESMRQKLTYRIVHLNGNTYLLSGLKVSDLNAMTFPVVIDPTLTKYSTSSDGYIYNSSTNYNTVRTALSGTVSSSGTYITIGQRKQPGIPTSTYYVYRGFVFFNTSALPSNAYLDNATLSIYKKDDYSTTDFDITIQNGQPTYPHNPMQTGDYNKNDYSGNGGALNTSLFTSGYNAIKMNNLGWINKTGITKLCLRSSRDISGTMPTGNEYINVHSSEFLGMCPPRLDIVYRNQSKIKNTGSTDIKGYLLIQVQFFETGKGVAPRWVVDNDTVNETFTRTINAGQQLPLDTIFNGKIRASDLTHGTGTYRVYTAFRDPEGNILKTNTGSELKAWWQFSKT